jgi:hypothetical protein
MLPAACSRLAEPCHKRETCRSAAPKVAFLLALAFTTIWLTNLIVIFGSLRVHHAAAAPAPAQIAASEEASEISSAA